MGYIRDRIFYCSDYKSSDELETAHDLLRERLRGVVNPKYLPLTPIMHAPVNGGAYFALFPDGSKEGWDTSDSVDEAVERTIKDLEEMRRVYWCWITVSDDAGPPHIYQHSREAE